MPDIMKYLHTIMMRPNFCISKFDNVLTTIISHFQHHITNEAEEQFYLHNAWLEYEVT